MKSPSSPNRSRKTALISCLIVPLATALPAAADLATVLDAPGLTWSTGGSATWIDETSVTHDGVDAAQNGDIGDSGQSWMETTITGPGTLTYWWKVSSEDDCDFLTLSIDGVPVSDGISGEVNWSQVNQAIQVGGHTVRWRYSKDSSVSDGSDTGWVDQVSFVPDGPVNTAVASNITVTSATLNGSVNPQGLVTTARFEYGTTPAYGSNAPVTLSPDNGTGFQTVSAALGGLQEGTLYHYRLVASNSGNPASGVDRTFTTASLFDYSVENNEVVITGYNGTQTALVIPATIGGLPVTKIDDYALNGYDFTSVVIPSGVTTIGEGAFGECEVLTTVTLPATLTTIGDEAFSECYHLAALSLPPGLTTIGYAAFSNCYALASLSLPSGLTTIGNSAFDSCESLTTMLVPASVSSLGSGAFSDCAKLSSVTLPASLTSIRSSLFRGCSSLSSLTIPAGVTSIGGAAFNNCRSLTSLAIPAGVTDIGYSAFSGCIGLTTMSLPAGLETIEESLFSGCPGLTSVVIPAGVTSVGEYAFQGCSKLSGINLPAGVTTIDSYAFSGCTSLTGIVLPAGVTYLGYGAFRDCRGILGFTVPAGVTSIREETFSGCTALAAIALGGNITSIGESAFMNCRSLASINLPYNLATIDDSAFQNCTSLTTISFPPFVSYIGGSVFNGCPLLNALNVDALNTNYSSASGVLYNKAMTTLVKCPPAKTGAVSIPAGVTTVRYQAFSDCLGITGVTLPNSVMSLGEETFRNCRKLAAITLPSGLTQIEYGTFYGCASLTGISIPSGVTSIGEDAFSGCGKLASVAFPAALLTIDEDAFSGCGSLAAVTLPVGLTSIGDQAFEWCSSLTGITIPKNVDDLGYAVFSGCSSLLAITVDPLNTEFSSAAGVLFDKDKTTLIKYPEAAAGNYAIPGTVTDIESSAFRYSRKLTGVTIPSTVTSIGEYAFHSCSSLKAAVIPAGVEEIHDHTFAYCTSLASVTLNDGLYEINSEAFTGCTSLKSIMIPASVGYLGSNVFSGSALVTAHFLGSVPDMEEDVFEPVSSNFKIYFLNDSFGFNAPFWYGRPAVGVDEFAPEIEVRQLAGVSLVDAVSTISYGNIALPLSVSKTFTITNTGSLDLTGLLVTVNGTHSANFTMTAVPASVISGGGSTTFTVKFTPSGPGVRSATLHIASNDSNESPFDIALNGTGLTPEIAVVQGTDLVDGTSKVSFGSTKIGSAGVVKIFTIKNLGNATLSGLAVTKNGTAAANYTVGTLGVQSIAPGATTTLKVTFKPSATGTRTAAIQIASNDLNEKPFDITLTGTGIAAAKGTKLTSATLALWGASSISGSPVSRGRQVIDGRQYLTLTYRKSSSPQDREPVVEVSRDLLDWLSGKSHTTEVFNGGGVVTIRDNTPITSGVKRYIRLRKD
ncbi:MAG: leucine-rich repeat protein [Luteolibacter sp.]